MRAEEQLAAVRRLWAGVLELPPAAVLPDSHFLQLGGDSLHWTRMALQLERLCGMPVPPLLDVGWATPGRCVERWRTAAQQVTAADPSCATQDPYCFPATPMQRGIWFAQQLGGDRQLYAAALLLHFQGPLDLPRLHRALWQLLSTEPLLQARFFLDADTRRLMLRLPREPEPADLEVEPEILPGPGLADALQAWLEEPDEAAQGFRAKLWQSGTQQFHLALQVQHLVCDGWSGEVLLARLAAYYNGAMPGNVRQDLSFSRHAWRLAVGAEAEPQRQAYWQERLDAFGATQSCLFSRDTEPEWPYRVEEHRLQVPAALRQACERAARAQGVTPFVLCQAACKRALARQQDEPRQVVLVPRALRTADEEDAIGCFTSLLPSASLLPEHLDPAAFLREEARRFDADCLHALPLDTLAAQLAPLRLPDGNPWSTVLLAFQNYPRRRVIFAELECRAERVAARRAQHALSLEFIPRDATWCLLLTYAPALFDEEWMERFCSGLCAALQEFAD